MTARFKTNTELTIGVPDKVPHKHHLATIATTAQRPRRQTFNIHCEVAAPSMREEWTVTSIFGFLAYQVAKDFHNHRSV